MVRPPDVARQGDGWWGTLHPLLNGGRGTARLRSSGVMGEMEVGRRCVKEEGDGQV